MHEEHEALPRRTEEIATTIVDAEVHVHRALGPGLLESVYEVCLAHEMERRGRKVRTQVALPVVYDSLRLEAGYRIDLIVDEDVIVEIKAVETLTPVHNAQLMTYLRMSGRRLGFLINFNTVLLKQGIRRMIL